MTDIVPLKEMFKGTDDEDAIVASIDKVVEGFKKEFPAKIGCNNAVYHANEIKKAVEKWFGK